MTHCCYSVVGVLIWHKEKLLMFERMTEPLAIACPAGHIDDHGSPHRAAVTEVAEEVGLTVTGLRLLMTPHYDPRPCRRQKRLQEDTGHLWYIYEASVSHYEVTVNPREAANPRWYSREELQALARRGALEPSWVDILTMLHIIS